MTAIIRAFHPGGFVLASDGRLRSSETLEVSCEDAQKVFQVGAFPVAFSMSGAHCLTVVDREPFDFRELLKQVPTNALGEGWSIGSMLESLASLSFSNWRILALLTR